MHSDSCFLISILIALSFLARCNGFTLSVPTSVFNYDQFFLNWTSLTSESIFVVIVLNDLAKAPGCPMNQARREGSFTVLDVPNREGKIGFYVDHEGSFEACAFTYDGSALAKGATPISVTIENIAKSSVFTSSPFATTITVNGPTSPDSESHSIAGPVVGGVIAGIILLIGLISCILFKVKNYRVIRLPPDSPSSSSSSTHAPLPDVRNIHPGVSPFTQRSLPGGIAMSDKRKRQYESMRGGSSEMTSMSGGGSGSSSGPSSDPLTLEMGLPPRRDHKVPSALSPLRHSKGGSRVPGPVR